MLFLAALLLAQTAPAPCVKMDANLPAPLAAWTTPGGGSPADLSKPVKLRGVDASRMPTLPASAKPGRVTMVPFTVSKPGIYGIAIDQAAWIDVTPRGAAPLVSASHGHGPECSTIRKIVSYDLKPGDYVVYLSGLGENGVRVMLVAPE